MKVRGGFEPDAACVDIVSPAVNCNDRAAGKPIDLLLLHYTGMPDDARALGWLTCAESHVSCHYFVWPDGQVEQMVPESRRARP